MTREDAISRQAMLDINERHHGQMPNHINHQIWQEIKDLPPVNPQVICPSHGIDCEDCPAYEPKTDVLDKIRAEIKSHELDPNDTDQFGTGVNFGIGYALGIIDKYKAESEK